MEFKLMGTKVLGSYEKEKNAKLEKRLEDGEITYEEMENGLSREYEKEVTITDGDKASTILIKTDYDTVRISIDDLKRIMKIM